MNNEILIILNLYAAGVDFHSFFELKKLFSRRDRHVLTVLSNFQSDVVFREFSIGNTTVGYHLGRTWPPPEMSVCYNRVPLKNSKLTCTGILNAQPPETAVINEHQSLAFPDSINRTVRQNFEIRIIF